ncbi:phage holin family protein [Pseudomonas aeruginosa]
MFRPECDARCATRLQTESCLPWLTLVLAILLGLVCRARGNLAHILRVY